MKEREDSAEMLRRAIREIDVAATTTPDTVEGRAELARRLGMTRRALTFALPEVRRSSSPSLREEAQSYLDGIGRFIDPEDAATQVVHHCVPLPTRDRLSSRVLQAHDTTKTLIRLILESINDGRLDGDWMQHGGYDYHAGIDYCQVELASRRARQAVRITSEGAVLMRERWTEKTGYPYGRFHRLLEATAAFSRLVFDEFNIDADWVATQSTFHRARDLPLGIVTNFGTRFYAPRSSDRDSFDVPARPFLQSRQDFAASNETAEVIAMELRRRFSSEVARATGAGE